MLMLDGIEAVLSNGRTSRIAISISKAGERTSNISQRIGNIEANLTFSNASRRRERKNFRKHLLRYGGI